MAQTQTRIVYKKNYTTPRDVTAYTSNKHPQHKIWPNLVRTVVIDRLSRVWCADVTYTPTRRGFLYIVAIMDWYSRKALAWRLSNDMDAEACAEALKRALAKHATPEIFTTDQGCQLTSADWIDVLTDTKVKSSMDGKGHWIHTRRICNRRIERLWRSPKCACV